MPETPAQLSLLDERTQRAELALSLIFRMLRSPRADRNPSLFVWARCDQRTRRMWLVLSQLPDSLDDRPWQKLDETTRRRLDYVLFYMTQFFEKAGELHLAAQDQRLTA